MAFFWKSFEGCRTIYKMNETSSNINPLLQICFQDLVVCEEAVDLRKSVCADPRNREVCVTEFLKFLHDSLPKINSPSCKSVLSVPLNLFRTKERNT